MSTSPTIAVNAAIRDRASLKNSPGDTFALLDALDLGERRVIDTQTGRHNHSKVQYRSCGGRVRFGELSNEVDANARTA